MAFSTPEAVIEAMLTIEPPERRSLMRCAASWPTRNTPSRLTSSTLRQSLSLIFEEIGAGRYAGIVDQDRDRSQRSFRRIESLGDRGAVGDVEGHGECLATFRADFGFDLLQAVQAAGRKDNLGTRVCQDARKVLPEARGSSRYQGCLAVE